MDENLLKILSLDYETKTLTKNIRKSLELISLDLAKMENAPEKEGIKEDARFLDETYLHVFEESLLVTDIINQLKDIPEDNLNEEAKDISGGLIKDLLRLYNSESSLLKVIYAIQQKYGLTNSPTD